VSPRVNSAIVTAQPVHGTALAELAILILRLFVALNGIAMVSFTPIVVVMSKEFPEVTVHVVVLLLKSVGKL